MTSQKADTADNLLSVNVNISRRDKAILHTLAEHYGADISEVVRMLLRQKAEQLPALHNKIAFNLFEINNTSDESGE